MSLQRITHAEIRCQQRYGENLGHVGVLEVKRLIGTRASMFVRTRQDADVWDVFYRGQIMRIVYDPRSRRLVTFLPHARHTSYPKKVRQTLAEKLRIVWSVILEEFADNKNDPAYT